MAFSTALGPQLTRMLLEQRVVGRESWLNERRAVALAGGGAGQVWCSGDTQGGLRASAAFGLKGGELCGCHDLSCSTCASNGGCGVGGCALCVAAGWKPAAGRQGAGRAATVSPGAVTRAVAPTSAIFDMHSHNFCSTFADWGEPPYVAYGEGPKIETDQRIGWLQSMKEDGVTQMVISSMFDATVGAGVVGQQLDNVTEYAWTEDPTYFVPFVGGVSLVDTGDAGRVYGGGMHAEPMVPTGAAAWAESKLATGFAGVGELFVHGHEDDFDDNTVLLDLCRVAAEYNVPVQVHWEIGNVTTGDPANNYTQLLELLEGFTAPAPFKLILAHCGAGPPTDDDAIVSAWKERIQHLIDTYPYVYFDIAGMQVGDIWNLFDPSVEGIPLTTVGAFILEKMKEAPSRFLVGIDTETRFETDKQDGDHLYMGVETYRASIDGYRDFLQMGELTEAEQTLILTDNAPIVLYGVPDSYPPDRPVNSLPGRLVLPEWIGWLTEAEFVDPAWFLERMLLDRLFVPDWRVPW